MVCLTARRAVREKRPTESREEERFSLVRVQSGMFIPAYSPASTDNLTRPATLKPPFITVCRRAKTDGGGPAPGPAFHSPRPTGFRPRAPCGARVATACPRRYAPPRRVCQSRRVGRLPVAPPASALRAACIRRSASPRDGARGAPASPCSVVCVDALHVRQCVLCARYPARPRRAALSRVAAGSNRHFRLSHPNERACRER